MKYRHLNLQCKISEDNNKINYAQIIRYNIKEIRRRCLVNKYVCLSCRYNYDSSIGDIEGGIAPGTNFEDIPDGWICPVCGVHMIEITNNYISEITI